MERTPRATEAGTLRCCRLPHLPGRFHGGTPKSVWSHWLFWLGLKKLVSESPTHSKPLGQATMVGRLEDAELYSNWGSSTYKLCGPGGVTSPFCQASSSLRIIFSAALHPPPASQPFYSKTPRLRRLGRVSQTGNGHGRDILPVTCE